MATTQSVTSTYAGELDAQKYISAALLSGSTLSQDLVTIKPNIKHKAVVKNLVTGDLLADQTCEFTDTSSVTLTERILEPKSLQVNLKLCKDDFRSDWEAISMGYSAHDNLPPSFEAYLVAYVAEKVASENEVAIWQGDSTTGGSFDGFVTQIALDADLPAAQEVLGTAVTAANVVAELGKVVDAIPSQLYGNEDGCIYVSQNIYRAYVRALGTLGHIDRFNNQEMGSVVFDGVKIVMVNGLPDDTAIFTLKSNLWFGTGLLNDTNMVKVIDTSETLGDENVRIVMRMTAGTQYGNITEIVTYGITNAVNPV